MFSDDVPRTWKWFVPAVVSALLFWGGLVLFGMGWRDMAALLVVVALLGSGVMITNYWKYVTEHQAHLLRERQSALSMTPKQLMLEAAKGVHPETLRLLLGEQARRWGLVSGSRSATGEPYKVLMRRPRVTEEFLVYFLRRSSDRHIMSVHGNLSDGDKSWDPQGIVTAYEMYDDLESLLIEEQKATRPFGRTKPGYWLGDWDGRSVGLDFGIDIEAWGAGADEGEEEAAQVEGRTSKMKRDVSMSEAVLQKSLEGLEQTSRMKARTEQLYKSKS